MGNAHTKRRKLKREAPSSRGKLCYYPRCRNLAAPRFGMFCAAKHKGLPDAAKARYRAARIAAVK